MNKHELAEYILNTLTLCIAQTGRAPTLDDWKGHFDCEEFQFKVGEYDVDKVFNYILGYFALENLV